MLVRMKVLGVLGSVMVNFGESSRYDAGVFSLRRHTPAMAAPCFSRPSHALIGTAEPTPELSQLPANPKSYGRRSRLNCNYLRAIAHRMMRTSQWNTANFGTCRPGSANMQAMNDRVVKSFHNSYLPLT